MVQGVHRVSALCRTCVLFARGLPVALGGAALCEDALLLCRGCGACCLSERSSPCSPKLAPSLALIPSDCDTLRTKHGGPARNQVVFIK